MIYSGESDEETDVKTRIKFPVKIKKQKFIKSEDDAIPLPDPFPLLKHYPGTIETALKQGNMAYNEKRGFYSEVASAMLRFKRYPSYDDYMCVAWSITSKMSIP